MPKTGTATRAQRRQIRRARMRQLRHASDCEPGIIRRRAGRGFVYLNAKGARVRDEATLARIRALAIPPAYVDVWICADRRGHLQATARDARGRKQYRYHAAWQHSRDVKKYRRLLRFGQRLPALRARLRRDRRLEGLPRDKVLAIMTAVMMATSIRIGNAEYARANHSYGLTTLRARHVTFGRDGTATLRFPGKSGQKREAVLTDRRLVRMVRRCSRLPGTALFQYDEEGVHRRATAAQLNEYLRDVLGERFSAKDFRTWAGTLTVIACLARTPLPTRGGARAKRAAVRQAIVAAAEELGNTPVVARKSYVCPQVVTGWQSGDLHRRVPSELVAHPRRLEKAAIRFLEHCLDA
ncbi:MAG TPA: DNA topoisomerase IB [Rhodanobacteraceae bacterium]|nr:DNA topoisomerase IB [Rhodanobacteraceae bacterium]